MAAKVWTGPPEGHGMHDPPEDHGPADESPTRPPVRCSGVMVLRRSMTST
jgi:hypothetical protein